MNNPKPTLEEGRNAYSDGDYERALKIFKTLAKQGDSEAYGKLGEIYRDGLGLPKDIVLATAHFRVASQLGLTEYLDEGRMDAYDFGSANDEIILLEKQMTLAQIAEAKKLAWEWMEEQGGDKK